MTTAVETDDPYAFYCEWCETFTPEVPPPGRQVISAMHFECALLAGLLVELEECEASNDCTEQDEAQEEAPER